MLIVPYSSFVTWCILKAVTTLIVSSNLGACLYKVWRNPRTRFFWFVTAQHLGSFLCVVFHTPNEITRLRTVPAEYDLAWLIFAKIQWTTFLITYLLKVLNSVSRLRLVKVILNYPDWLVRGLDVTAVALCVAALAVFHAYNRTALTDKVDSYAVTAYGVVGVTWDAVASLIMVRAVTRVSRELKSVPELSGGETEGERGGEEAAEIAEPGEKIFHSPSTKSLLSYSDRSKQRLMYNIILVCLASNVFFGYLVSGMYLLRDRSAVTNQIYYILLNGGVDTPMLFYLFNVRHVVNTRRLPPTIPKNRIEPV